MAQIPPVGEDELLAMRALLRDAGLPDDVGDHRETLLAVARDDDRVIGGVAVEVHGGVGLLRSLVVDPAFRSSGLGTGLVAAADSAAGVHDLAGLYLLTETAEGFFERLGYARIERSEVPEALQGIQRIRAVVPGHCRCDGQAALGARNPAANSSTWRA